MNDRPLLTPSKVDWNESPFYNGHMGLSSLTLFIASLSLVLGVHNVSSAQSQTASTQLYSFEDLQTLYEQKNYNEFFRHARDIRPSERKEKWQDMVTTLAESYLKSMLKSHLIEEKSMAFVNQLTEWPSLRSDEFFIRYRGELGLKYFKSCFEQAEKVEAIVMSQPTPPSFPIPAQKKCLKELRLFWEKYPEDVELGMKLGSLVEKYHLAKAMDLWPLYQGALKHKLSEFYCKEDHIQDALWKKLLPASTLSQSTLKNNLNRLMNGDCWQSFKSYLKTKLYSPTNKYRQFAYQLLKAKDDLASSDKDFYQILYVLEDPEVGDLFNESWNTINRLGKNYERRRKLLQKLKAMDPLPGKVFAIKEDKKRNVVLKHLYKNIPEYLDYYAETCLKFFKGQAQFPHGNPTLSCKDLFRSTKGKVWVSPKLQQEYASLPDEVRKR